MFDALTILLTFRCNFECDHCVFRCSPEREETIDPDLARATIDAATAYADPLALVTFTGGEPFLERDLLRTLIEHADSRGVRSGVVTNAYWATTVERAKGVLEPLRERGLSVLTTSIDTFHLDFVESVRVANAIRAALALGMETHLNIVVKRGVPVRAATAHEVLGLSQEEIADVHVCEFPPTFVGFAADRLRVTDAHRDALAVIGEPCLYVLRSATVTPDGSVYGCCGVGGATDHGPSRLLFVGRLAERPLAELLDEVEGNLLFNIIAKLGPHHLLQLASRRDPSLELPERFGHICDVCQAIADDAHLRRAVAGVLEDLRS
ncbi:MAG: radical SAM protein [Deltaproteobacteria bacterium]|nr:radical SAM protein [Deltaproteobacteria bacterium]